jgi:hypothetical protein
MISVGAAQVPPTQPSTHTAIATTTTPTKTHPKRDTAIEQLDDAAFVKLVRV